MITRQQSMRGERTHAARSWLLLGAEGEYEAGVDGEDVRV